ncbi:MAG: Uncharacterised protein [Cyanobium sp. ARS6]|nr:MAG: Uncharacterised protein [Cyanobium sp. ARS6]
MAEHAEGGLAALSSTGALITVGSVLIVESAGTIYLEGNADQKDSWRN